MYRVEWLQSALDDIARASIQADAEQITAATRQIDKRLQSDPDHVGESRHGGRRIEFFAPLAVTFEVNDDDKTVAVLHVRVYGKRKK
jgi:mRNA-degrading endonuclease RelE of RelBE toxin-antitoxin system